MEAWCILGKVWSEVYMLDVKQGKRWHERCHAASQQESGDKADRCNGAFSIMSVIEKGMHEREMSFRAEGATKPIAVCTSTTQKR